MAEGIELVDVALADVSSSCQGIRESHETETGMLVNESASSSDPDHRAEIACDEGPVRVKWQLYFYTVCASISELANGYDIGAFSFALLYFKDDPKLHLSHLQVALLVGQFNLVAALGCLIAGTVSDVLGRRISLMLGNLLNVVGTLIFVASNSFNSMFLGRFVMGLGAGIAFMGPELYTSELSPPHVRGLTSTFGELFINIGILIGYLSGWVLQPHWRWMVSIGALIPLVSLVGQIFIVETPRWLLEKGHAKRAVDALRRTAYYSDAQLDRQVREIEATLTEERAAGQNVLRELFCPTRPLLHAMLVGFGVSFFQQANGSEAVVYFTPTVLRSTGIEDVSTLYGCTAAVGACKACFVALALCTMDRVGRVPLLLVSSVGCVVGLMLLGGAFIDQHSNPQLAVLGLCCFMACFSVGWGPLTGVLLAEVFPLRIRGTAVGIGWAINRVVSGSVALCFLPLTRALGESGTFFAFAFVGLLSVYFTAMVVPETNNLTLEAITHLFNARATAGATSSPSILQRFTTSRRR